MTEEELTTIWEKNLKSIILFLFMSSLIINPVAHAESSGDDYWGLAINRIEFDDTDGLLTVEPSSVVAKWGVFLSDKIVLEGRLGGKFFTHRETFTTGSSTAEIEFDINTLAGIYGLFYTDYIYNHINAYGIVGFTKIKYKGTVTRLGTSFVVHGEDNDFSYGFGLKIGNVTPFNFEIIRYLSERDFDATAINIGVNYMFD